MIRTDFIHKTPSSNILINVKAAVVDSRRLADYENKRKIEKLCEACPTYGRKWSCPPWSPSFSKYDLQEYPYAALVLFWCDLDQFRYTKTEYVRIRAANTIMKSRMDRFMRSLERRLDGVMISNGNCRLCNPCSKKKGQPCKRPEAMRYSMEALGLNVGRITADFLDHRLLWYKDKTLPAYLSAAACLLLKEKIDEEELNTVLQAQKSAYLNR
jgi:predicted metal-binding protein